MGNKTRAIILADGECPKWHNYLERPKHLIELYGKTLLKRSVDLLRENGIDDIYITTHNDKYSTEGAKLWPSKSTKFNIDKIWACQDLWVGDTLLIWGDVFFTKKAMKTAVETPADGFRLFARFGRNSVLRSGSTEVFAFRITDKKLVSEAVNKVRGSIVRGKKDYPDNTLTLYSRLVGFDIFDEVPESFRDRITIIDDLTDDIDFPKDYRRLLDYINNGKVA